MFRVRKGKRADDLPSIGERLKEGNTVFLVTDVFPSTGREHPGMILEWTGYNPSTDRIEKRAQAFTTKDWRKRWKEVS